MVLDKKYLTLYFSFFLLSSFYAQDRKGVVKDSTEVETLKEVVVTGQYNPQSVKKSVFEVKVINRKDIEQQAANNLADLLNQTLNINVTPDPSGNGKSGVGLFGLNARYFKVLIDNIPVINEAGFGNNTDLTLINLDDVEQIEIVEGAMGVQYGANAISGVINVITRKSSRKNTQITAYVQEETISDEYGWFDKGRHIQSIKAGHNFSNKLYGNVAYTRNYFTGFLDNRKGESHDLNDGLRGYSWLPKEQHNTKLLLNYKIKNLKLFYKFDYFNERIDDYNDSVDLNENAATATSDPQALDEIYRNNRYVHHLNANGLLSNTVNYDIALSYQEQTKDRESYTYRIRSDQKLNRLEFEYLSKTALFSRATFSNLLQTDSFSLQAGYELTHQKGTGSPYAVSLSPDDSDGLINSRLDNYDVFASSEINVSKQFSFRPGARVSFSNSFTNQYMFSLGSKYLFKNDLELRVVVGSSNRTPEYDELFTYIVDVNHNIQGNPDLSPERGYSTFIHLKKKFVLVDDHLQIKNKLSASYINVKDRIVLTVVNQTPLEYKYNNIDLYKSFGLFSENTVYYKRLKLQLGASLLGISQILDSSTNSKDDFLYNFQLNTNINYVVPKWNTSFSLYFKYIGKQYQFVEKTNTAGDQEYFKEATNAYNWMDATVKKSFLNKKIELTAGVRNLLDVTSVNTTAVAGGAHSGPPTSILLGYGRSYFLKLAYNLNFNTK